MVQEIYFTGVVSIKVTATGFWMFLGFPRGLDGNEHGKIPLTLSFLSQLQESPPSWVRVLNSIANKGQKIVDYTFSMDWGLCDSLKQDTYIRKCVSACIVIICNVILSYVCLSKPLLILRTTSFLKAFCFAALEVGVLCKRLCVCAPNQRSLLPLRLPITLTERVWADQQHKESSMAGLIEFEFKYIIYIYMNLYV